MKLLLNLTFRLGHLATKSDSPSYDAKIFLSRGDRNRNRILECLTQKVVAGSTKV